MHIGVSNGGTQTDSQLLARLRSVNGPEFDSIYMHGQIMGHEQAMRLLETELRTTRNPEIRALVLGSLPIIEEHLALAEAVDRQSGGAAGAQAYNNQGR